ncbi:hypothetical protein BpHYR1_006587 [Brachionus plicatilis]|uniref:Uncharacterized protein n=1 Tax=Brachionus plicatilis TaxID=10195 RepID=A0A3M7P4Z4_BRAPC|nr:hypothetical protein BpHYR1_006587 [Brachionus plicatilis]
MFIAWFGSILVYKDSKSHEIKLLVFTDLCWMIYAINYGSYTKFFLIFTNSELILLITMDRWSFSNNL